MPRSGPEYSDDLRQGVDYFEVLGVDETASAEDVVSSFRAKIRAVHPDLNGGKHDPEAVSRIARARKTLTGADREAYLKAREAKREASRQPPSAPSVNRPPVPEAADDVRDGPEARAWQRAAEEVRRRAEAEVRSRPNADRGATVPPRAPRPVSPGASSGPDPRTTGRPASWPRTADESRRSSTPRRSELPFERPAVPRSTPRPFELGPLIPPFRAGRRAPMSPPRLHRTPDEILRDVQRRSAEILDEARWSSEDTLAEAQRRSRDALDAARRRSEGGLRRSRL